jgi:DNA-binding NarL/FixJ family response regulator
MARVLRGTLLIADGWTNAEIAERLGMTSGGVGTQVGRIIERLGLACRADIALRAVGW